MTSDEVSSYFVPHVEIVISDQTLPLSVVEDFAGPYGPHTGGDVRIIAHWGGPAAGGPGWGGPEIAVAIVLGEMLRRASSEAYALVRSFILGDYHKIRTRTGARLYVEGAMAIGIDSETRALRILFCFPEGLTSSELEARLRLVERTWPNVLSEFEEGKPPLAETGGVRYPLNVCWREDEEKWQECHPAPDEI